MRVITRLDETCREVRDAARVIGDASLMRKMEEAQMKIKRDSECAPPFRPFALFLPLFFSTSPPIPQSFKFFSSCLFSSCIPPSFPPTPARPLIALCMSSLPTCSRRNRTLTKRILHFSFNSCICRKPVFLSAANDDERPNR